MEIIDRVLSHMNEPDHDLPLYSDLEKLVHAAHMQDIWQKASAKYMDIQVTKSSSEPSLGMLLPGVWWSRQKSLRLHA